MVTYTIYMKELSSTSAWQDITHAVAENKIPIRKGFGSLSDAIDMGSVSLTLHMESLEAAALLHTSQKQVLIQADSVTIFEGISYNDADVELQMNTDVVYALLKFKPYSSQFETALVPEDTVYTDVKICDPADTGNSLVHLLFALMIDNLPGQLPDILSAVYSISTTISNTDTLPIVLLEKGETVEDYLTNVLYQNGYAYYMDLFSIVLVDPFKDARVVDQVVDIGDLVESPSISQEPFIKEKKAVVRFPKVEEYTDEVVYELNTEVEDDGFRSQVEVLEAGDYYPLDDEDPAELDADYEPARETEDLEFVYAENPRLDVLTRKADPEAEESTATLPAYITVSEVELTPTAATVQLYNQLAENVSLRNIRVIAETAYFRNWSSIYEDDDTDATDTEDLDGIFMANKAAALDFIRRYRMEINAEKTPVTFESSLLIAPNTLISIAELPYELLIRSVTDRNDNTGVYEYEAVAYSVITVNVGTRIRVSGQGRAVDGFSPVPVRLYALGDADAPYEDSVSVGDDTMNVVDDNRSLGIDAAWSLTRPTPGEGEYVWYIIGYYTPPATWPTDWTTPVKDSGLNAYGLQISAPEGTTIQMSGRGTLLTTSLKFTAILSNILPGSVTWGASNGTLNTVPDDDYSRTLDCSTVTAENVTITISATVGGVTYSASIGIQRIRADITPQNLGTVTALPTSVSGGPLASGDFFLVGTTFVDDSVTYTKGEIWEYNGSAWVLSTDQAKAMALLADFADLDEDVDSTVIGNAVVKKLVAIDAVIKTLLAQNITAGPGTGASGTGFRFRAMSDVDHAGADNPVFDVMYGDAELFKVIPTTGDIYIGDYNGGNGAKWDQAAGKFYVKGDGEFSGSISGASGYFQGQLNTVTLQTLLGGDTAYNIGSITDTDTLIDTLTDYADPLGVLTAEGTIGSDSIQTVSYSNMSITQVQFTESQQVLWEWRYKTVSAIIVNVTVTITTDGSTYTYRMRKIKANVNYQAVTPPAYPSYPSDPADIATATTWSDVDINDSHSGYVPSISESDFDSYGENRVFGGNISSLVLYDDTQERLLINNLPTSQPSDSNRVWNDSGTLKITS